MENRVYVLAFILFVCGANFAYAGNIIYVDVNAPNDPGTGTEGDPFLRIQDGINAAQAGETVEIRAGLYIGPGNYNLNPNGKSITVRSTNPNEPNIVEDTIIDANQDGRGFYFDSGEDANCVVSGLTIRNGYTVTGPQYGGNVYCISSSPTIKGCIIEEGYAENEGGGIFCQSSSVKIVNCTITNNEAAYYGGGIGCYYASPYIIGCLISDNTASVDGGGLDEVHSNSTLINCLITNNSSSGGAGLNCYEPGLTQLENCTIAGNSATDLGGALACRLGADITIKNNILWGNTASQGSQIYLLDDSNAVVVYSDVQGGQGGIYDPCSGLEWGRGNLNTDPCFVRFDSEGEPNLWDFHLQSVYGRWDVNSQGWVNDVNTSACIDSGDPNSAYGLEPWPNGKRVNMGCYGGSSEASKNGNPADFDINGRVDFNDYALFSERWGCEEDCIEDLTLEGIVDFSDLDIFCDNWLWYK